MKFMIACGGTAGHINPGIAVAGRLGELVPGSEFLFIGAEGKMETELVPREGYAIETLNITNISRGHSLKALAHNVDTVKNTIASIHEAKKLIRDFKPDAVIGTGGYVCYPVLKAASELGIPTAVHESNALPGLTTKMLADIVDSIMVGFEESRAHYKHPERVTVTGTPVRREFGRLTKQGAREKLGIAADEKLVVSVWGSLGAAYMNDTVCDMIERMGGGSGFRLIHSAGTMYFDKVRGRLDETAPERASCGIDVRQYIYDMPEVMTAADLVLCRAGASTLAELTYMGKPCIIVPSPNVANNHQEKNARVLERAGGARVLPEGSFDADSLLSLIGELLGDGEELRKMSAALRSLSVDDATEKICENILSLVKSSSAK